MGPGETVISRVRRASNPNLTLNDNNLPVALDFGVFFGTSGAGRDLTLYLQTTSDGLVSFTVASTFLNAGGNWLNLTLPAAARTLIDNIATGDRFIIAMARPEAIPTLATINDGQGGATHGGLSTHGLSPRPQPLQLAMTARTGLPTADFNLRVVAPPPPLQLALTSSAGLPTAAFNLRTVAPLPSLQLAIAARTGLPSAAFNLRTVAPAPVLQLAMSARTGLPTAAFNARTIAPPGPSTVTVNLTGYAETPFQIRWDDNISLGSTFDLNGQNQTLSQIILFDNGMVRISISAANDRFTAAFEATGRIIFTASDGETLGGDDSQC